MGIDINVVDGTGSGNKVSVDENALRVSTVGHPPLLQQKTKIFRQFLTDDGLSTGSSDMLVDGSAVSAEFWVPAHEDDDRYITAVSFVIGDGGANLNEFGGISALTNGCDFEYKNASEVITIHGALKSNWDFIRMCMGFPAFGDAASAYRLTNVEGGAEAYAPVFNFLAVMPPHGLKLDAGTKEKIVVRVNDDCRVPDVFNAIAYGFDRFE